MVDDDVSEADGDVPEADGDVSDADEDASEAGDDGSEGDDVLEAGDAPPVASDESPAPEVLSAQAAAVAAEAVYSEHCSTVAGRGVSEAAAANTEVSAVWLQVSQAYEVRGDAFLRYWRGVLGQCLGHEDRAQEDLSAFVAVADGNRRSTALVRDAKRRLARLGAGATVSPARPAGAVSLALGAASAGLGGILHGAAFEQGQLSLTDSGWTSALDRAGYESVVAEWDGASKAGLGLLIGGAAALGVGAVVLAVSESGAPLMLGSRRSVRAPPVAIVVVPAPGGFSFALGGRF